MKAAQVKNQLAKVLTSEGEKYLSEKLNNYCLGDLEYLKKLIEELSHGNSEEYEYYLIHDNSLDFWDYAFGNPSEAIEAIGPNYNLNDKYLYEDTNALIESCDNLTNFYSDQDVEYLTTTAIKELKKDTVEETKKGIDDLMNWSGFTKVTQEKLLEILEN